MRRMLHRREDFTLTPKRRPSPPLHMVPREDVEDFRGYQVTNVVYLGVAADFMSLRSNWLTTDERSALRLLAIH